MDTEGQISTAGVNLAVAVEKQEYVIPTAIFEYFSPLFAVAWAGFVGSDCRQAIYKRQKLQYFLTLLLLLLSVQTKHILKWQYEKHFFVLILSFFITLTVPN